MPTSNQLEVWSQRIWSILPCWRAVLYMTWVSRLRVLWRPGCEASQSTSVPEARQETSLKESSSRPSSLVRAPFFVTFHARPILFVQLGHTVELLRPTCFNNMVFIPHMPALLFYLRRAMYRICTYRKVPVSTANERSEQTQNGRRGRT